MKIKKLASNALFLTVITRTRTSKLTLTRKNKTKKRTRSSIPSFSQPLKYRISQNLNNIHKKKRTK